MDSYRDIVPEPILEGLREQARELDGARILHVNATAYGGGVSELLRSSVPLLRDLGLTVDWSGKRFRAVAEYQHDLGVQAFERLRSP